MKCSYLAQGRMDLGEVSKHMAQSMSKPREADLDQCKRLARYLIGRLRAILVYKAQPMREAVSVETDSDWAQCPLTRKSTSGLLAALGDHCIKTQAVLQSLITLSVAESEYYAQVKGAALGISLC